HKRLKKIGINVISGQPVQELDDDAITIGGKEFDTKTAIWTSGVENNPFFEKHRDAFKIVERGKVSVDKYLRASKDIFVLGDNNSVKYSGMAWPAMHQAEYVAKYLAQKRTQQKVKPFKPRSVPSGIPVGENWGYVEWKGIYVSGRTGYFARRLMELYGYIKLVSLKRAVRAWRALHIHRADSD
ncbi:MAG TPA: FAD-dependent oxidoreductase, partial [Candidatus Saccharibacteria bacterium]|nr:FAD-dependent oxidoreductase [Candidatus Saccharibacteria bacterium]